MLVIIYSIEAPSRTFQRLAAGLFLGLGELGIMTDRLHAATLASAVLFVSHAPAVAPGFLGFAFGPFMFASRVDRLLQCLKLPDLFVNLVALLAKGALLALKL